MAYAQAGTIAANETRAEWNAFLKQYKPLMDKMMGGMSDTAMVDAAAVDVPRTIEQQQQAGARALARRGVAVTGDQAAALERRTTLNKSLSLAQGMNSARTTQRAVNETRANTVADLRSTMMNNGMNNLNTAAGLAANRDMANRSAEAAAKAQKYQTYGQIGSSLAMLGGMALMGF